MNRRAGVLGAATLLVVLTTLPAYSRIFTEATWRAPVVLAAVLAAAAAAALRALRVPWWASLVVSVVGLAMFTSVLHLPAGPQLPDAEQWDQLRSLTAVAIEEVRVTPSPAPVLPGLLFVLTTAFWIVTHLAHEVVVRWHRTGLGLVPVLALWSVPLAIAPGSGRTWGVALPFLAAAALALLLSAPDTLPATPVRLRRASITGLAVGAIAVVAAIVLPGALPGYGQEAWIGLGSGADPRGYQPIVDVSERLKLPSERDVLRVRSEQRSYLRLAGLDSFDGYTWRLGPPGEGSYRPDPESLYPAGDVLPPETETATTEPVFAEIEVLELANIYVPVPYQPVQVLGPIRDEMVWSTEGGFLATWDTEDGELDGDPRVGIREGVSYRVQAARPSPSYDDLASVTGETPTDPRFTALPREYPALREQAEEVYAAAGADSRVDQAFALQEWFIGEDGGFTYDLDVPALRGDQALERFVLEDKVGYCEYFATAMAVMLRETGIPARVAVGFLPGTRLPANPEVGRDVDEYTVSTRDAHAWVEVLFPGYGWLRFEPTPRDDQTQMVPREDNLTPVENEREREARDAEDPTDEGPDSNPQLPDTRRPPEGTTTPQSDSSRGTQSDPTRLWPLALVALGLGGVAVVAVRSQRAGVRSVGDDPASRILTAQRRLLATAAAYGLGRRPSETTAEVIARWQAEERIPAAPAADFTALSQRAAFGGDIDDADATTAEALAIELNDALRASVDTRGRLLAPVRVPLTTGARRTRDAIGAVRDRLGG